jgi:FK506-binding protein 1
MLFINLADDDWEDMGITSRFQRRKLQLILKAYRFRYQKKKERVEIDEDDELISEYSPSELSDIIAQEDISDDELSAPGQNEDDGTVDSDEVPVEDTEEQRLEKLEDERNVVIDLVVPGDNENFPMVGDIVRLRYVCFLKGNDKPIGSTKASMQRPSIEFVLGTQHIIKGIDRALPMMSIGERSKISVSAEYAYGKEGLFPLIPPDQVPLYPCTPAPLYPCTSCSLHCEPCVSCVCMHVCMYVCMYVYVHVTPVIALVLTRSCPHMHTT